MRAVAGEDTDESVIRKVDQMNPDYILREQGEVLNWFAMLFMTLAKKMSRNKPAAKGGKKEEQES